MDLQAFILQVLTDTSAIAQRSFGKVSGTVKDGDNNQVLTETDLEIGNFIITKIQEKFPDHNIIDEEAGVLDKGSHFTWVVDPIDGTSNFANGVPLYGTMFGLLENFKPLAGGIALPGFSEIYIAESGKGAFCNEQRINVTSEPTLLNTLVSYGIDGHQQDPQFTKNECALLAEIVLGIRNLRTSNSVFDITMVAKGCYGGYLNRTCKVWDTDPHQ